MCLVQAYASISKKIWKGYERPLDRKANQRNKQPFTLLAAQYFRQTNPLQGAELSRYASISGGGRGI